MNPAYDTLSLPRGVRPHPITRARSRIRGLIASGLAAARRRAANRRNIRFGLRGSVRRAAVSMRSGLMGALSRARERIAARRTMQPRGSVMLRRRHWPPGTARRLF